MRRVREVKFNWQLFLILFTLAFLAISIVALNTVDSEAKSLRPGINDMVQNCIQQCQENFGTWQNQGLCVAACNKLRLTITPSISPFQKQTGRQPTTIPLPTSVIRFPTNATTQ